MEAFSATLQQMLQLSLFVFLGFFLQRRHIFDDRFPGYIAKLETTVLLPAMVLNTFSVYCTPESLGGNMNLFWFGAIFLGISIAFALPVSRLFSKDTLERNCYCYSLIIPNSAYVGNAVVQGVLGSEALFRYMIFCIPSSIFCYTVGVYWLTQTKDSKFGLKGLLNPIFISVLVGLFIGLLQIPMPAFLTKAVAAAGGCVAPLAMLITGFIIGQYDMKKLFQAKKVYILTALRLAGIPLTAFALLKLLAVDNTLLVTGVVFACMPLGLNTILLPASCGGDTTTGTSMALISNLLSILTIPLIFSLIL